jgi:hypothetical protein
VTRSTVIDPRALSLVTALLIAGLPGAGKSHFCRWLAAHHDFAHVETDRDPIINGLVAPDTHAVLSAVAAVKGRAAAVVLEWGFRPVFLHQVRTVIGAGFVPWWFGGSEAAARRSYRQRVGGDRGAMQAFETQLSAIQANWASIAEVFAGRILPAVDLGPTYMPPDEIYKLITEP